LIEKKGQEGLKTLADPCWLYRKKILLLIFLINHEIVLQPFIDGHGKLAARSVDLPAS
jgi:hypothetical protein